METPQMNINQMTINAKQPNQILFVLGLRSDWGLYMHNLFELARETNSSIHLLETGAPLGTGSFTSTAVMDTTQEVQTPQPDTTLAIEPQLSENPAIAPTDTLDVAMQTSNFVEELVKYFQDAGFTASGDWKPEFESSHLGDYAKRIGAGIIAIPRLDFIAGLFQKAFVARLEGQGFRVEVLSEITDAELETLKLKANNNSANNNSASNNSGGTAMNKNQEPAQLVPEATHDTDLAKKPVREREQLLDSERRDEMNENDDARVDGKHYSTPEEAQAIKQADVDEHASDHLGATDEKMDRTQGPPAMGGNPAPGKGERPIPNAK